MPEYTLKDIKEALLKLAEGHQVYCDLATKLKELTDQIREEPKSEKGWWKPKEREDYWTCFNDGEVFVSCWAEVDLDKDRRSNLNCFRTQADAELSRDFRLAQVKTLVNENGFIDNDLFNRYAEMLRRHWVRNNL